MNTTSGWIPGECVIDTPMPTVEEVTAFDQLEEVIYSPRMPLLDERDDLRQFLALLRPRELLVFYEILFCLALTTETAKQKPTRRYSGEVDPPQLLSELYRHYFVDGATSLHLVQVDSTWLVESAARMGHVLAAINQAIADGKTVLKQVTFAHLTMAPWQLGADFLQNWHHAFPRTDDIAPIDRRRGSYANPTDDLAVQERRELQAIRWVRSELERRLSFVRQGQNRLEVSGLFDELDETNQIGFDDQTQVLTRNGWKWWPEVRMTDRLAGLTPDGAVVYERPVELIRKRQVRQQVHVDSQQINLIVGAEQSLLTCGTTTVAGRRRDLDCYQAVPAASLIDTQHAYLKHAPKGLKRASASPYSEDVMRLLGFFIGDGKPLENRNQLRFNLARPRKISYLSDLAERLGLQFIDGRDEIRVSLPKEWHSLFAACTTTPSSKWANQDVRDGYPPPSAHVKQFPQKVLFYKRPLLLALYEGVMEADGTRRPSKSPEGGTGEHRLTTTSIYTVGGFQQLCLHLGLSANAVQYPPRGLGIRPSYVVGVIHRLNRPFANRKDYKGDEQVELIDLRGQKRAFYGAVTPTGTLYVRRYGLPSPRSLPVWTADSRVRVRAETPVTVSGPSFREPAPTTKRRYMQLEVDVEATDGVVSIGQLGGSTLLTLQLPLVVDGPDLFSALESYYGVPVQSIGEVAELLQEDRRDGVLSSSGHVVWLEQPASAPTAHLATS